MKSYTTSKDYQLLKQLLDNGDEVVCQVEYNIEQFRANPSNKHCPNMFVKDIAFAKFETNSNHTYDHYVIYCRGREFISVYPVNKKQDFIKCCESGNVEFIVPNSSHTA